MKKRRMSEWLWAGGIPWGLCLCALLCGGCLSAASQHGGTEAIVDGRLVDGGYVEAGLGGSALPFHQASAEVGRSLASAVEMPVQQIRNNGWRMGALFLTGPRVPMLEDELKLSDEVLFAWGYQFQFAYGEVGSTVGLVDVVPLLMGLDESLLIPAINVLVGLRFPVGAEGQHHLEFGIGPHYSPRWKLVERYFPKTDDVHIPGLGLAAGVGYWFRRPGGVNISIDASFMWAGDLQAYGLTFGWNFAQ